MRAISPTHADGYMQLFPLYILPLFNVYRNANDCVSRVKQLYDSQPIIYSANESLNAITSVILYSFLLWELKRYGSFLLVNGVNTQQKISVTQVIRIEIHY